MLQTQDTKFQQRQVFRPIWPASMGSMLFNLQHPIPQNDCTNFTATRCFASSPALSAAEVSFSRSYCEENDRQGMTLIHKTSRLVRKGRKSLLNNTCSLVIPSFLRQSKSYQITCTPVWYPIMPVLSPLPTVAAPGLKFWKKMFSEAQIEGRPTVQTCL